MVAKLRKRAVRGAKNAKRKRVLRPSRVKKTTAKPKPPIAVLSGAEWVAKFPGSHSTDDLVEPFKAAAKRFIAALSSAGAAVVVASTFRPPQRAYLMHFAWLIAKGEIAAEDVPPMVDTDINWVHATTAESMQAAQAMIDGFDLVHIASLASRHTVGRAVDMTIQWPGSLSIADGTGTTKEITTLPRNGSNTDLHIVGASYGVIKLLTDPPHWSEDGH